MSRPDKRSRLHGNGKPYPADNGLDLRLTDQEQKPSGMERYMQAYELHPLCTLFPRLNGGEFATLRDDIAANGLRSPIVLHDGMILDGGNRYRACLEAKVEPKFETFNGGNLVSFVLSANLHRRHMTAGQQAAIVASATDWARAQTHGGNRKSDQGEGLHLETVAQRAAVSGATTRTQKDADKLVRESPKLAKEVTQGKKSLYQAVKETKPAKPSKILPRPQPKVPDRTQELLAQLHESQDNARELAESLEAYTIAEEGVEAAAKEIKRLQGQLRTVESQRDQYMTKCSELVKTVKALERKIAKLESGK